MTTVLAPGLPPRRLPVFDGILFDLDGTVCLSGKPLGMVVERLNEYLSRAGRYGVLVTNNTSKTRSLYQDKLKEIGLDRSRVSIVTPIISGADYLTRHGFSAPYILGTQACIEEFATLGVRHDDVSPDCVVVAFDTETTYAKLDRCCEMIRRGIPLFQTNIDLFCPTSHGPSPDCGSLLALLLAVTGVRPRAHFGKPGRIMASYLKKQFKLSRAKVAMVGDRQSTDVLLGNRIGATSIWVKSGDPAICKSARVDFTFDTMEAFLDECP